MIQYNIWAASTTVKCLDLIENTGVVMTISSPAKQYFVTK